MTVGPVEYLIIGFPDNKFTGQIAPELAAHPRRLDQHHRPHLHQKDVDGNVTVVEYDAVEELAASPASRRNRRDPHRRGHHRTLR